MGSGTHRLPWISFSGGPMDGRSLPLSEHEVPAATLRVRAPSGEEAAYETWLHDGRAAEYRAAIIRSEDGKP